MAFPFGNQTNRHEQSVPSAPRSVEQSGPVTSLRPPTMENGRMRLESAFRKIGFDLHTWKYLILKLEQCFESLEAAACHVETLMIAGWGLRTLRRAVKHDSRLVSVGAAHILQLQSVLTGTFGLDRGIAIEILSSKEGLLTLSPEELTKRVWAALGDEAKPSEVARLLDKSTALVKRDAAWLQAVRMRYLEKRGIEIRQRPYYFSVELKNETHATRLKADREPDPPPDIDDDEGETEDRQSGRPPVRQSASPPDTQVVSDLVLNEFRNAGWNESDALAHLAAFPDLLNRVSVQRLGIALNAFAEMLNLKDCPFTELLWKNTRRIVIQRELLRKGITEPRPLPEGVENSPVLTAELESEARRIAAFCHASLPKQGHPVRKTMRDFIAEATVNLCRWGFGQKHAVPFLREHPELLFDYGRPLVIVSGFVKKFEAPPNHVHEHLRNEWERAVLFEDPSTFNFLPRINALRGIPFSFEKLRLRMEDLDFMHDWSRLYANAEKVQHRLNMVLEKRVSVKCGPEIFFRGSYNDFLAKLDRLN
jgi:hypothetical protein